MDANIFIFIAVLAGIVVGATGGYFIARYKSVALATLLESKDEECRRLAERLAAAEAATATAQGELSARVAENSALKERIDSMNEYHKAEMDGRRREFEEQLKTVRESLQNSAQEILAGKVRTLGEENSKSIEEILKPMREKMEEMRKGMEQVKEDSIKNATSVETQIKSMMEQTVAMGNEANKLANALTSKTKIQGNWGEMILETLLQNSGLTEGLHYECQVTLRDAEGKAVRNEDTDRKMQPDVVVHFPDNKDVVIDSKVSLKAFYDYCNAESEQERAAAQREHIVSVRKHVRELSDKNYSSYIGKERQSVGYVIMFVPIDAAMQLAVWEDGGLWHEAFKKGVFITSEQNLMLMLNLIYNAWSQMAQCQNQQEVYRQAETLLNRIAEFGEDIDNIGKGLKKAHDSYTEAKSKLLSDDGRKRSVKSAAEELLKLGASPSPNKKTLLEQKVLSVNANAAAALGAGDEESDQ